MSEHSTHPSHSPLEARLGPIPAGGEYVQTPETDAIVGAELIDTSTERSRSFLSRNSELVDGMLQGEQQLAMAVQSGQDILGQLKYRGASKEETATQLREVIQHVRTLSDHQGEALDGQLRQEATRFLNEASDTISDAVRLSQETDLDDQVRLVVRQTESVAEEISGSVRIMDHGREERTQALRDLARLVDDLEHDQWGAEATAAQIGKALSDLEDATGNQFRGLSRIQAEFDTLRRLTQPS